MIDFLISLFFLASAVHSAFFLLFWVGLKRIPPIVEDDHHPFPKVSVIVAAHNELENLRKNLHYLLEQAYPDFEIILVLDRCGDGSEEWVKKNCYKSQLLRVLVIDDEIKGFQPKKRALTEGIQQAKGEIILLTDADCWPVSNNWIARMAKTYQENTEIVVGYSPYEKEAVFLNVGIRSETVYTGVQYLSMAALGMPYMAVGRNLSFRKSFFQQVGGYGKFAEVIGGDDDLFVNQYGESQNTRICLHPDALVKSTPKRDLTSWRRQKQRHLGAGKHYRFRDKFWQAVLHGSHTCFWLLLSFALTKMDITLVICVYMFRQLCIIATFRTFAKQTRNGADLVRWLPLLDLLFPFYFTITGFAALISKRTKWS